MWRIISSTLGLSFVEKPKFWSWAVTLESFHCFTQYHHSHVIDLRAIILSTMDRPYHILLYSQFLSLPSISFNNSRYQQVPRTAFPTLCSTQHHNTVKMPISTYPLRTLAMLRSTTTPTNIIPQLRTLHFCGPKAGTHRRPQNLPPHYLVGPLYERGAHIVGGNVTKPTTTSFTKTDPKTSTSTQYATRLDKRGDSLESMVWDKTGKKVRRVKGGLGAVRTENGDWRI
jgi:hypothetical protein